MLSTSTFLALALHCAARAHPDTTHEVARVESGFNPYAIAEIIPKVKRKPGDKGVVSYFPESKEAALKIVKNIEFCFDFHGCAAKTGNKCFNGFSLHLHHI